MEGRDIDSRLVVERFEDVVRDRVYYALPTITGENDLGVFNNTLNAACVALTERYLNLKVDGKLTKPITCRKGIFESTRAFEFQLFVARKCSNAHVYSRQEVVDMYTGQKRVLYAQAADSLLVDPLTKRDSYLKTFIKFEKCNLTKAPRIINPRSTRYTLELARYLKKLEKPVYRAIHKIFRSEATHTVIKGLNVVESASVVRAKWDRFLDPVFVGGDITKLDMHVGVDALRFEHMVYNLIFKSRRLRRLLEWQLFNRGRAYFKDGCVSFKMAGTRSSGDINTSMGNVLIVCYVIWGAVVELGLDCELINNGDDFGLIFERGDLQRVVDFLPRWFRNHGFVLVMEEPVDVFERIEFCQTKPVWDGQQWRMCRLPQTVFKKDTICTVDIPNAKMWKKWLAAVGDCGLSLTSGLPVLPHFYRMFRRAGIDYSDVEFQRFFKNTSAFQSLHNLTSFGDQVTEDSRLSFYFAFGILPDDQRDLEAYFDAVDIGADFETCLGAIRDNNLIYPNKLLNEVW